MNTWDCILNTRFTICVYCIKFSWTGYYFQAIARFVPLFSFTGLLDINNTTPRFFIIYLTIWTITSTCSTNSQALFTLALLRSKVKQGKVFTFTSHHIPILLRILLITDWRTLSRIHNPIILILILC